MKRVLASIIVLGSLSLAACAASDDGGAGGAGGSGGTSGTDGGTAVCGNGVVEGTEACDGQDLRGQTCADVGAGSGTLACTPVCKLDTTACCKNDCTELGASTCSGDVIQNCQQGASGCLSWTAGTDCAQHDKICSVASGAAACTSDCVNQCETFGAAQCNATVVEACDIGADGCLVWTAKQSCAAPNPVCNIVGGVPQCTACTNPCPTAGATQCSGNVLQECVDLGGECRVWATKTDCTATGKLCTAAGGTAQCGFACTNKCTTAGSQICMNNNVHTCTQDASGCLDWAVTQDCTAQASMTCVASGTTASCQPVCSNPCTTAGEKKCSANAIEVCTQIGGSCLNWQKTFCPLGQACDPTSFSCVVTTATGEDCGTPIVIKAGTNTVNWTASVNNYMTPLPCGSSAVSGGDVVLAYQSSFNGIVEFSISKPVSNTWIVSVGPGPCGNAGGANLCTTEYAASLLSGSFAAQAGQTYFFYVADTTLGAQPLNNPLSITLTELNCATFNASAVTLSPANGATSTSLSPVLTVDFNTSINPGAGTITLTGNKGTNLSFNLATSPSQISFSNDNKTMTIMPGISFPAGELVTVSWSGLSDSTCSKPVNPAAWSFTIVTPPCAPATGGMIGASVTRVPTAVGSFSENYLAVDTNPSGYVYLGNTSTLYRLGKAGGTLQSVNSLAGLSSTHLGYGMFISGSNIFTVESKFSGLVGYLWRLSSDAGASWSVEDFATFPTLPDDDLKGGVEYKGTIYLMTDESTTTLATQIWSVPAGATTLPASATLEASFFGEGYCSALAVDDKNFYAACGTGERVVAIDRVTKAVKLLSTIGDLNTLANAIYAHDANADGLADFLYYKGSRGEVYFVCQPNGPTTYADTLVTYSSATSTYGLGFDPVAKKLYAFDDASLNKDIVIIQ